MFYIADIFLLIKNPQRIGLRERKDTTKIKQGCNGDRQFHMSRLVAKSIPESRRIKLFHYINTTSVSQELQFQPEIILLYYIINCGQVYLEEIADISFIFEADVFHPSSLSRGDLPDN